ncbi:MAG TPA: aminotransferase class III-fold pyridoxal phosphate-dependent enzyme, partial [Thermomicrobiales bacterium]|nr:aminotransferase class III-fold pyridoxal phosphate-dependent enzyme [Thermomicrobiales bacterium]
MSSRTAADPAEGLFDRARGVLASGVSASMRLHPYLGRPFYASRGDGAYLYDLDGRRFIDYNVSNGATMLGHNHAGVRAAIEEGLGAGIITAAETPHHERLAEELTAIIPAAERVRFASTGTEVTMVALRLARHATGRTKVLKFGGHFHGLSEPFLYKQESDDADAPVVPSSGGVPGAGAADVVIVPWNDAAAFEAAIARHGRDLAAVIAEPVFYNAGCIPPAPGFLALLRERTRQAGALLIFDEVLSGFRMALGGAQEWSGVTPDLCTLAKAVANGMPLSVVAGRADLMEQLAPTGPVAHSGTYSGHLLSVLSALATLNELRQPGVYEQLNETGDAFYRDLQAIFDRHDIPAVVQGRGSRFGLYFGFRHPVRTYTDAMAHDHELARQFTIGCLDRGVYFHAYNRLGPPGHAGFSLSHTPEDFAET